MQGLCLKDNQNEAPRKAYGNCKLRIIKVTIDYLVQLSIALHLALHLQASNRDKYPAGYSTIKYTLHSPSLVRLLLKCCNNCILATLLPVQLYRACLVVAFLDCCTLCNQRAFVCSLCRIIKLLQFPQCRACPNSLQQPDNNYRKRQTSAKTFQTKATYYKIKLQGSGQRRVVIGE